MKNLLTITFLFLTTTTLNRSFAAEVKAAYLDQTSENILVEVAYGGGCKKHEFSLKVKNCEQNSVFSCNVALVEKIEDGFDPCEAYLTPTITLNIKKNKLQKKKYSGAYMVIQGDKNQAGEISSATVQLPVFSTKK